MKSNFLKLGMLIAVVVGMAACNKSIENNDEEKAIENEQLIEKYIADSALVATRDSSGLYYVVRKANPAGDKAKAGDEVRIKFDGYLLNGTKVLSSTNDKNLPFTYPFGSGVNFLLPGMEIAANRMRVGEVNTIFMPFYLAYGSYNQGNIPAYSVLKMNIELASARSEVKQIDDFLLEKQFTVSERTTDNLVIVRSNTIVGDTIGSGKAVSIKYKGKLLNGDVFDNGDTPAQFTTGTGNMIPGFDRAIRKMRKGEKGIIIFPSALGYGKAGRRKADGSFAIAPYAPLQFEIEVL